MAPKRLNKSPGFTLNSAPGTKQVGEPNTAYEMFNEWTQSGGRKPFAEIALDHNVEMETIRRYSRRFLWNERLQRLKGYASDEPESLVLPADDDPVAEVTNEKSPGPELRTWGAEEVLSKSYFAMSGLYSKLLTHAEVAINNIDPHSITSMSEIKALVNLTTDLQKAKVDLANQLLGIEELAKAVAQLRKARK